LQGEAIKYEKTERWNRLKINTSEKREEDKGMNGMKKRKEERQGLKYEGNNSSRLNSMQFLRSSIFIF
jgi:hypothetical protein